MTPHRTFVEFEPAEETLDQIDQIVARLAELARADLAPRDFYRALVEGTVRALAAVAGAVWTFEADRRLQLEYQVNLAGTGIDRQADSKPGDAHTRLLQQALNWREPRLFAPHAGLDDDPTQEANPTDLLLMAGPIRVEGATLGIVEVLQRPDTSPAAQQGFVRFLATVLELASDFHRSRLLRQLQSTRAGWNNLNEFAQRIHRSLDLDETAYAIANEARRVLKCDRVSVVLRRGSKCRLLAVGGVGQIERRGNLVRQLEKLAAAVVRSGEPLWFTGQTAPLPPQVETALHALIDESHARLVAATPLVVPPPDEPDVAEGRDEPEPLGALVVEQFDSQGESDLQERVHAVCVQSSLALRNALEYRRVPLLPLLAKARWFRRAGRLPKLAVVALAGALMVAAAVLVPADFEIEAPGALHPRVERDVFAPSDGIVSLIHVDHGQKVKAGQVLAELRRPELELELRRVSGELQTASKRLRSVQAARVDSTVADNEGSQRYQRLTAEEEELKEQLKGLQAQSVVLRQQEEALLVRSPIDGQVLSWNVEQMLQQRPVRRGQSLLTVADVDGPWVVELHVPDQRAGHVLQAQQQLRPDLDVSLIFAADPQARYYGRIEKRSLTTDTQSSDQPSVTVVVDVDRSQIEQLRAGATATGKIYCGRRSLGYVWLHELWEVIQARVLF